MDQGTLKYSIIYRTLYVLLMCILWTAFPIFPCFAQVVDTMQTVQQSPADTLPPAPPASVQSPEQGDMTFQASDSLTFNFRNGRVATLYGSSKVNHASGDLTAGKISLDLNKTLLSADTQTPEDTLSQPVLTRRGERIRSNSILYNYKTEKGRFKVARKKMDQGNIIGTTVKNTGPHVVFLEDAIYSTCGLDHPHYYIKADRMKVVDDDEVFFTNARLYLLDIPYPMIFPFGYLPAKLERRQSGLLEPTYAYQEQARRGIGLQRFGWFQYFNDYLVGQITADIFTSGTFFLNASTSYAMRNKFNGRVEVGYSRERGLEETDPDFSTNTQKRINLVHSQTFSPYANMSANIDLRTADYHQRNSYDIDQRAETSTSSSLNYRYRQPENLYNFNISVRQNQNFRTNRTQLSGPDMNFSLRRITPFKSNRTRTGSGQAPWYENISINYQNNLRSNYTFNPIRGDSAEINWFEALFDPQKFREATGQTDHYKYAFQQQAGINMSQLIPSRFVNVSANVNYSEFWYPTSIRKEFNPETNRVETRQVRGFESAREYNTGVSLSTTFYGMSTRRIGKLEGFRHTVRPNIGFSYRPDFGKEKFGYYQQVQSDTLGNTQTYSIFENEIFRGPGRGEQRSLSFSLNNTFETKLVKRDSTGEKKERVLKIIDQLNFSSSYNFAADSLKLSNMSANLSSNVVSGVNFRVSAQFNFYERDSLGRRIDRFLWEDGGKIIEPLSWNISASTSFNGGRDGGIRVDDTPHFPQNYDPFNQSVFHAIDPLFNTNPVKPLTSPWSVSFNFSYRWTFNPTGKNQINATLNAQNISFRLTPKWQVNTRVGYDFIEKDLTPSQFSLQRNLHCWNLSFTMNPFGEFQYFFFKLSVNSSQLQSLFQKLPVLKNLERSSSPTGRSNPVQF